MPSQSRPTGGDGRRLEFMRAPGQWSGSAAVAAWRSDHPDAVSLWPIERFVEEVAAVRSALGPGRMRLLSPSWGAALALKHALHHAAHPRSLALASGAAPSLLHRLRQPGGIARGLQAFICRQSQIFRLVRRNWLLAGGGSLPAQRVA
jgi:pimeloyl-ACP methyl ester carboxylesterase